MKNAEYVSSDNNLRKNADIRADLPVDEGDSFQDFPGRLYLNVLFDVGHGAGGAEKRNRAA